MFGTRPEMPDARPGEDAAGPALAIPELPPLREFTITRITTQGVLFDEVHRAHTVEHAGPLLMLKEMYLNPVTGPSNRVVVCINGNWLHYTEAMPSGLVRVAT